MLLEVVSHGYQGNVQQEVRLGGCPATQREEEPRTPNGISQTEPSQAVRDRSFPGNSGTTALRKLVLTGTGPSLFPPGPCLRKRK